jgi:hypothetical protein
MNSEKEIRSRQELHSRGQGIDSNTFVNERRLYTQFQTWLGDTRGVVGCPLDCKYCFFQLDGKTPLKPRVDTSPEQMIAELKNTETYHPEMAVNFGSETDVFSTPHNINYYYDLLRQYGETDYPNPIVFISKCSIPDKIMDAAVGIKQPVLFYISYSGLGGSEIEPHIKVGDIRDNFVRLKNRNLPAIHYWRPFLPQNSTIEIFDNILDHVTQFATCSVINGLRLNNGISSNMVKYWPELMQEDYDFSKTGEFWPQGVRSFLSKYLQGKYPNYPVFFGNTPCSVAYVQEKSDIQGLFSGRMCKESQCPPTQRGKCARAYQRPTKEKILDTIGKMSIKPSAVFFDKDKIVAKEQIEAGKLVYLRTALRFPVLPETISYQEGYNWAQVREDGGIVEVPWKGNWIIK